MKIQNNYKNPKKNKQRELKTKKREKATTVCGCTRSKKIFTNVY
jgi:hypothetical protein